MTLRSKILTMPLPCQLWQADGSAPEPEAVAEQTGEAVAAVVENALEAAEERAEQAEAAAEAIAGAVTELETERRITAALGSLDEWREARDGEFLVVVTAMETLAERVSRLEATVASPSKSPEPATVTVVEQTPPPPPPEPAPNPSETDPATVEVAPEDQKTDEAEEAPARRRTHRRI